MGILSSPTTAKLGSKSILLLRWCNTICSVLFLAGVVWQVAMFWPAFNRKTYFSENALLPGLVNDGFSGGRAAEHLELEVRKECNDVNSDHCSTYLYSKLRSIGLETHVQNYSVYAKRSPKEATNLYAVVRARRAAGGESIVLAVRRSSDNLIGLTLALQLASFWYDQVYWAKDIVIIVTPDELGMQAWLGAYHDVPLRSIQASELTARAGLIQAALALELHTSHPTSVDISYHMLDGQLPNLDLLNLCDRLIEKQMLQTTLNGRENPEDRSYFGQNYQVEMLKDYVRTGAEALQMQALGRPIGLHSLFGQYSVEAVTLTTNTAQAGVKSNARRADLQGLGRMVDGIFRSVNNLLERFHQSFFFYILASTKRFISISVFMPAIGLMAAAPLLRALCTWVCAIPDFSDILAPLNLQISSPPGSISACIPAFIVAHAFGLLWYLLPLELAQPRVLPAAVQSLLSGVDITSVMIGLLVVQVCIPVSIRLYSSATIQPIFRCLALIEFGLLIGIVSLLNNALGLFIALVYVPVLCIFATRSDVFLFQSISRLFLILCHPLVLSLVVATVCLGLDQPTDKVVEYFIAALRRTVNDTLLYGSLLYSVVTLWLIPVWFLLYCAI